MSAAWGGKASKYDEKYLPRRCPNCDEVTSYIWNGNAWECGICEHEVADYELDK
ncbi:hypothetical protein [Thermoflavimicrobium daqui]|jgi:hypothetical protein|uniref:hypothetical protein n=1 Tax=Thermoflavimicrobium daqui TaxID=2137476 RepID=UPI00143D5D73|nr:hypothetical protein [Thermoflavimicrobium daqui]